LVDRPKFISSKSAANKMLRKSQPRAIILDVGASVGLLSTYMAKLSKENLVYAIEPLPDIAQSIEKLPNTTVICRAICSKENIPASGKRIFKRMKWYELSTLNDVKANIDTEVNEGYLDGIELDLETEVKCSTLEDIIQEFNINTVDFLKIDTQGSDLEVFLSAGEFLKNVKIAVLEFPYISAKSMYEDEIDLLAGVKELSKHNFYPVRIVPNGGAECNLFIRNGNLSLESYFKLEEDLRLKEAPTLKLGPHNPYVNMSRRALFLMNFKIFIKHQLLRLNR
jgi:FkbM family methyltransferase